MLTARNVIVAIIAVAVLSVVSALISLFGSGERQSTIGRDSYGTRSEGYRGVHDLLETLGFQTERISIPALPAGTQDTSYVLWNPRIGIVQTEPTYLKVLADWIRDGGYLVVTPCAQAEERNENQARNFAKQNRAPFVPVSVLESLGLVGVSFEETRTPQSKRLDSLKGTPEQQESDSLLDIFQIQKRPSATYAISCAGEWEGLSSEATQVKLPTDQAWHIRHPKVDTVAQITFKRLSDAEPNTLAAMFSVGKGRIVVVSNPFLASNTYLDSADNSVLLTHLMTGLRPKVDFDEFYHGLTVRGNALWLLSKPPYAVVAASIMTVVIVWVWRQAIFLGPSHHEKPVSRRSLGEYIEAMSRFMLRGRESSRYTLREIRSGVLWHFSKNLGLPPQQSDASVVLGLLGRRMPKKAVQLDEALKSADTVLNDPRAREQDILLAIRKVSDCLSA